MGLGPKRIPDRSLVDGLMDLNARLMRRNEEDQRELRRLTGLALILEACARKDGNPARVANMLTPDCDESSVAD